MWIYFPYITVKDAAYTRAHTDSKSLDFGLMLIKTKLRK